MTNTRKADASDWAWLEGNSTVNRCDAAWSRGLIELRDRVEALEAQQRLGWRPLNTETVYGSKPAVDTVRLHSYSVEATVKESLTAQPRGLVERVADGICKSLHCGDTPEDWETESRAAIRAVAAWMRQGGMLNAAELLEQEAGNG